MECRKLNAILSIALWEFNTQNYEIPSRNLKKKKKELVPSNDIQYAWIVLSKMFRLITVYSVMPERTSDI